MRYLSFAYSFIWHSYLLIWICGIFASIWPVPSLLAATILCFLSPKLHDLPKFIIICLIFCSAFYFSTAYFNNLAKEQSSPPVWAVYQAFNKPTRICGHVEYTQALPDSRLRILLSNVHPQSQQGSPLPGLCSWTWEDPQNIVPLPGQTICINSAIRQAGGFANSSAFNIQMLANRILWRIWSIKDQGSIEIGGKPATLALWRYELRTKFVKALGSENSNARLSQAKAILLALIFGDRSQLNQTTINEFAAATLAHSLALSGQHLCIAGLMALFIATILSKLYPNLFHWHSKFHITAAISIPLAFLYLWIGNFPPSLLRATRMLFFITIFIWRNIPFCGLDLLASALLVIILVHPLAIFDLGLQLSALCVAIIIITAPVLNSRLRIYFQIKRNILFNKYIYHALQILLISFTIQLAILPLSLYYFDNCGIWFPLNLLWLPFLALWTLPLAVAGLIFSTIPINFAQFAASFILDAAALPCELILKLLNILNEKGLLEMPAFLHPHWTTLLAFGLLIITLAWIFGATAINRKKACSVLVLILFLLCIGPSFRLLSFFDDEISVTALDVGQGQSILLKFPANGRIIIDGGGNNSTRFDPGKNIVGPILANNNAPKLSAIINSHPDLDHLGGLFYLLQKFNVGKLFHNGHSGSSEWQSKWLKEQQSHDTATLYAGDEVILGDPDHNLKLEVLHPPRSSERPWKGNAASLVIRLVHNGSGLALFTGDAEKSTLKYLLNNGANLQSKVVFAPHHGSNRSLDTNFYKAAQPQIVAACCGLENRWGYPGKKLKTFLEQSKVPLVDTGNNGKIKVEFSDKLKIETARNALPISDILYRIQ